MKVVSKPIQVIAWFDEGNIMPLKFKIEEENNDIVIKINHILKREKERLAGRVMEKFTCSSYINGVEKIFEIKFDVVDYKWILFKC